MVVSCQARRRQTRDKRAVRPNQRRFQMAELPPPPEGIVLAHFIVSDDVERSKRFYTEVLCGPGAFCGPGGLTYVALTTPGSSSTSAAARLTTSPRSSWRRRVIPTGSAASSTSGLKTSKPCTPNGAPGALTS